MERYECPDCNNQSVERRGAKTPRNVKLRKVAGLHDEFVCRNSECKWSGGEEEIGEVINDEPSGHVPATVWDGEFELPEEEQKTEVIQVDLEDYFQEGCFNVISVSSEGTEIKVEVAKGENND